MFYTCFWSALGIFSTQHFVRLGSLVLPGLLPSRPRGIQLAQVIFLVIPPSAEYHTDGSSFLVWPWFRSVFPRSNSSIGAGGRVVAEPQPGREVWMAGRGAVRRKPALWWTKELGLLSLRFNIKDLVGSLRSQRSYIFIFGFFLLWRGTHRCRRIIYLDQHLSRPFYTAQPAFNDLDFSKRPLKKKEYHLLGFSLQFNSKRHRNIHKTFLLAKHVGAFRSQENPSWNPSPHQTSSGQQSANLRAAARSMSSSSKRFVVRHLHFGIERSFFLEVLLYDLYEALTSSPLTRFVPTRCVFRFRPDGRRRSAVLLRQLLGLQRCPNAPHRGFDRTSRVRPDGVSWTGGTERWNGGRPWRKGRASLGQSWKRVSWKEMEKKALFPDIDIRLIRLLGSFANVSRKDTL